MFTGLVQAVGRVSLVQPAPKGMRLAVDVGSWDYGKKAAAGDSVSVAGVCLTLVEKPRRGVFAFDVVEETLRKTRLGSIQVGSRVNLEHAATASTLMGGHIVQGHVDGVGRVVRVAHGHDWKVWFALPQVRPARVPAKRVGKPRGITIAGPAPIMTDVDLWDFLVPQGSVCVEGVSLTIAGLWENTTCVERPSLLARERGRGFAVALIPTTLACTTLGGLHEGEAVNLEMDVIAKMVARGIQAHSDKRSAPTLKRTKSRRRAE